MKKAVFLSVVLTLLVVGVVLGIFNFIMKGSWKPRPEGMPTAAPTDPGWINLLSEENSPKWKNITDSEDIFSIKDSMLHIFGKSMGKLRYAGFTGETFSDFKLHLEFRVAPRANSGVFLRVKENDPVRRGFEVQILDDHGRPSSITGSGAIYDVVTPMFNMARPAGEWNSYDITVQGKQIIVIMNGWKVVDTDFSKMTTPLGKFSIPFNELPMEGMIALQDHGGEVWFRNIYVLPLRGSADAEQRRAQSSAPSREREVPAEVREKALEKIRRSLPQLKKQTEENPGT